MKKSTIQVTTTKDVWTTKDGVQYFSEYDARKHEIRIFLNSLPVNDRESLYQDNQPVDTTELAQFLMNHRSSLARILSDTPEIEPDSETDADCHPVIPQPVATSVVKKSPEPVTSSKPPSASTTCPALTDLQKKVFQALVRLGGRADYAQIRKEAGLTSLGGGTFSALIKKGYVWHNDYTLLYESRIQLGTPTRKPVTANLTDPTESKLLARDPIYARILKVLSVHLRPIDTYQIAGTLALSHAVADTYLRNMAIEGLVLMSTGDCDEPVWSGIY